MTMATPYAKWGHPTDERREVVCDGRWIVATRRFDRNDGTSDYQYKVVRENAVFSLDDQLSGIFGWVSKPPGKRKAASFPTREVARLAGIAAAESLSAALDK